MVPQRRPPHSVPPPPLLIYLQQRRRYGGDPFAPGSGAPPPEGGTSLRWRGLLGGQRDSELLGAREEEQLVAAAPWQIPHASSPSMWLDGRLRGEVLLWFAVLCAWP
jgi:hypothetical protein